jgi:hypothetical protein
MRTSTREAKLRFKNRVTWGAVAVFIAAFSLLAVGYILTGRTMLVANLGETSFVLTSSTPSFYWQIGLLQQGYAVDAKSNVTSLVSSVTQSSSTYTLICPANAYFVGETAYNELISTGSQYNCKQVALVACYGDCLSGNASGIVATSPARGIYYLVIFGPPGSYSISGEVLKFPQRDTGTQLMQNWFPGLLLTGLGLLIPEFRARQKKSSPTSPPNRVGEADADSSDGLA